MRILVTGATGKVGGAVVRAALADGHEVRALVRDPARGGRRLPGAARLVVGDVTDQATLRPAVDGVDIVFNAMGVPEQWLPDPGLFERVNVAGSANVARAAADAGVRRLVHTSTIDVFDALPGGHFDETNLATAPKQTPYERSKQRAERAVLDAAGDVEVVVVNPATVYGFPPYGPTSMEGRMFRPALRGRLPVVPPGGFGLVFTEGLARGHLAAADAGRPGERYILSDAHVSLRELTAAVVSVAGRGRPPRATIPPVLASALAAGGELVARMIRQPPPLARGQLHYLRWNAVPDASRARAELGWEPTPLAEGLRRTLAELDRG
ncbi:NAD-dependent epimerase/dehydratase family protein [Frankia sp. AgB32]|uniref:NAD-dependent epimerase/dehydratase family protein n=1 Tax=Frankia sp. AgB32 TaxID=631119 RepID=UPI00200D702C|nr:NAD-dependent epimerase/dehydratase family protein [Frankia sp. AgB32]MCK9895587.1 NAD-dependent epimerase/dehydratase family protein [Frankia sp. AgB32]